MSQRAKDNIAEAVSQAIVDSIRRSVQSRPITIPHFIENLTRENSRHFPPRHHWFPLVMTSRSVRLNSILMTCHYPDLGSASDWSCCEGNLLQPVRSTTQFSIATRPQYGIYALAPQRHYERKPVWGCFLRLSKIQKTLNSLAPQPTHLHY